MLRLYIEHNVRLSRCLMLAATVYICLPLLRNNTLTENPTSSIFIALIPFFLLIAFFLFNSLVMSETLKWLTADAYDYYPKWYVALVTWCWVALIGTLMFFGYSYMQPSITTYDLVSHTTLLNVGLIAIPVLITSAVVFGLAFIGGMLERREPQ